VTRSASGENCLLSSFILMATSSVNPYPLVFLSYEPLGTRLSRLEGWETARSLASNPALQPPKHRDSSLASLQPALLWLCFRSSAPNSTQSSNAQGVGPRLGYLPGARDVAFAGLIWNNRFPHLRLPRPSLSRICTMQLQIGENQQDVRHYHGIQEHLLLRIEPHQLALGIILN
jgi:hypothetical protein